MTKKWGHANVIFCNDVDASQLGLHDFHFWNFVDMSKFHYRKKRLKCIISTYIKVKNCPVEEMKSPSTTYLQIAKKIQQKSEVINETVVDII